MLVQHVLYPDDPGEHCMCGWEVDGPLDPEVLERAVDHVHRRHQALHASYRIEDEPVAEPMDVPAPPVAALTASTPGEARALLRQRLGAPFRLEDGVVWRVVVVTVSGAGVHLVGLAAHHIAVDGWSEVILTRDIGRAYNAFLIGGPPLDEPAPTLAEVAEERRTDCSPELLDVHRRYWLSELAGAPQLQYPGAADPRPRAPAALLEIPLSPATIAEAERQARTLRVTPFLILLTAYGRALADVSGQHDICVGTPVAIRGDTVLDRAVSCLIELLCLRLRFAHDRSSSDDLTHVTAALRNAFDAGDVPLREIVRMVNPPRNGRPPLFQNIFAYQNIAPARLDLATTSSRAFRPAPLALPTELFAEVWRYRSSGPLMVFHYQPERVPVEFVRDLAERMVIRLDR
jgi:hypothetical protein